MAAAGLTLAWCWPGEMVGNTLVQLEEIRRGQLTDWHPPLMAVVWRALGTRPESLLVLAILTYWLGMALIADELARRTAPKWGYGMLALGLTPISLFYLEKIQRDNFMVAFFLITIGVAARLGARAAAPAGLLGCLFRTDALFAMPPLLVQGFRPAVRLAICLALALALIPLTAVINRSLLGAENARSERSLQLFDMAGIDRFGEPAAGQRDFARCYTPFYWDRLELECNALQAAPENLTPAWLGAIANDPGAYLTHRLVHFNHSVYFLVPPLQECVTAPVHAWCRPGGRRLWQDAIIHNAFLWPVTWIVVGTFLLFSPLVPTARALVWSAMIFTAAHFFISVATAFRYYHWPELALQIAVMWQVATAGLPHWRRMIAAVLAVWAVGYAYRYAPLLI